MSTSRDSVGDSKLSISSDSKSEANKTYELAIARETVYSSPYTSNNLRILVFSPDLIACYQTNASRSYLRIYNRNGKIVFAFPESFVRDLVFSPAAGELVTVSSDEAHRWKNFESKEPISEVIPEMKILCSEYGRKSYIPRIPKPIHAAPDGTWYFSTMRRGGSAWDALMKDVEEDELEQNELKQFDGKKITSIAKKLPEYFNLIAWNQNDDIIGLSGAQLYKIKSGIVREHRVRRLKNYSRSLTLLPDCMVAVHSEFGIEIIDTKNQLKSIGEKELRNISTLLTNPDTGELIVVFNDGRINIFAVNKTPEGGVEFVETASFDSELTGMLTAEWNPYTHSILVMSKKGFKEIDLGHGKKIREAIDSYIPKDLAKITMEYLGFFAPSKPISPADVDKPDPASADWSDLNEGPK